MDKTKSRGIYVQEPLQSNNENTLSTELKNGKHTDTLLQIKELQNEIKKEFKPLFLNSFRKIIDKCFANAQKKKTDFITEEKLVLELLQLLQSQKKFKDSTKITDEILTFSIFDKIDNQTGKIVNIDCKQQIVEYIPTSLFNKRKHSIKRSISFCDFFDPHSLQFVKYYQKQRQFYDNLSYEQTFLFLTQKFEDEHEIKEIKKYSLGRGIPLDDGVRERSERKDLHDI